MFESMLLQTSSVSDITGLITAIAVFAGSTGIGGLMAGVLAWMRTQVHSKRSQDAITMAQAAVTKVETLSDQVQSHSGQISTALTAATSMSPQLQALFDAKDKEVKALTDNVNELRTKLAQLTSVIPHVAAATNPGVAPTFPKTVVQM